MGTWPLGLVPIHRLVRAPDELVDGLGVCGPDHPSDTRADRDRDVANQERVDEGGAYAPFGDANLIVAVDVRQDDGELIPAEPGDLIAGSTDHRETLGGLAQQLVAEVVTMDVVDLLEVV